MSLLSSMDSFPHFTDHQCNSQNIHEKYPQMRGDMTFSTKIHLGTTVENEGLTEEFTIPFLHIFF